MGEVLRWELCRFGTIWKIHYNLVTFNIEKIFTYLSGSPQITDFPEVIFPVAVHIDRVTLGAATIHARDSEFNWARRKRIRTRTSKHSPSNKCSWTCKWARYYGCVQTWGHKLLESNYFLTRQILTYHRDIHASGPKLSAYFTVDQSTLSISCSFHLNMTIVSIYRIAQYCADFPSRFMHISMLL